jgi:hypothetical protein
MPVQTARLTKFLSLIHFPDKLPMNPQSAPLSAAAREVIDTSQWFSIATTGPEGPRLAACWTRNILKLGYLDEEIVVPVWRLEHTEANLCHDPRIELLFVSPSVRREKGEAQGLSVMGTGAVHRDGPRAGQVRAALEWPAGALVVTITGWRFHLP